VARRGKPQRDWTPVPPPDLYDDDDLNRLLPYLTEAERFELDRLLAVWTPEPHQVPPEGDWYLWIMLAGRGSGKTDALAHYVNEHALGPPCHPHLRGGHRIAIIAPTQGDAVESCVDGPSGLRKHNPTIWLSQSRGGQHVYWPNGASAKLFGASAPEDVERLRAGGNRCLAWLEELAAWRKLADAFDNMTFGLRMGRHPHAVASTTPKPRKQLIELLQRADTVRTHATTADNPHLDAKVRQKLYERYVGTRLGRQELEGQILEDVPGALWSRDRIDELRIWEEPPLGMRRVVISVDPSGGEGPENDEQGIAACGLGFDGHGYLLGDLTCKKQPEGWARVAVDAYHDYSANYIVAERNYGGDMVLATIRSVDRTVPVKLVTASRGKAVRAEPVASLAAQGRIHQVGEWPEMEDELATWDPLDTTAPSPNRLDAYVWGFTELLLGGGRAFTSAVGGERGPTHPPGRAVAAPQGRDGHG
jgi:phage terminase large subunit-like protein